MNQNRKKGLEIYTYLARLTSVTDLFSLEIFPEIQTQTFLFWLIVCIVFIFSFDLDFDNSIPP